MKKNFLVVCFSMMLLAAGIASCGNPPREADSESDLEMEPITKQEDTATDYEDIGAEAVIQVKNALGKALTSAIGKSGTIGAISYCNIEAMPLTDSISQANKLLMKRVSDKPRNPANQANEGEIAILNEWKKQLESGKRLKSQLIELDGKMVAYYPIKTNKMCMQCHGDKQKDILPEVYAEITKKYPADKAFGYAEKQVRGMFVVVMDKR